MVVSAGNLDGLVNLAGPVSDLYGINFSGGTTTGTGATLAVASANVQIVGSVAPGTASVAGGTFRIISVNDTAETATFAYSLNGVAAGTSTLDVIGFTSNGILLAPDALTSAIDVNNGASYVLSNVDSVLSTSSLSSGTTLQITSTGTYNAPPVVGAPTSTQATVIGALGYVLTLDFAAASVASQAQAQLTPISTAIAAGTISPAAATGGTAPSLNSGQTGLAEIDTSQNFAIPVGYNTIVNVASGPVSIIAGAAGNHLVMSTGQGSLTYAGFSGADTVYAGGGNALIFGGGSSMDFVGGNGAATIIGGSGTGNTVAGGAGSDLVFGTSALNYVGGTGAATVIGAGNGNTVTGGAGTLLLFASSSMTYAGGSGAATVIGGGGPLIANLGAGGGIVYGSPGGGDILSSSSSNASILVGGGVGDVVSVSGAGNDTMVAGGGAETLNGAASSGNLVLFGGPGADDLVGGSGNDLFIAEPGNETLTGGAGNNAYVFIANPGTTRTDVITDFDTSHNAIEFFGYGSAASADAAALASATTAGGVTTVSLSDGTHIQFLGAPTLHSYNFF